MSTPQFHHSIVLGKFMPPHHGHRLVIDTARRQSKHVTLIVSLLPNDVIPATRRVAWLQQLYPGVTVVPMSVGWNATDAQAWADGALAALGGQRPDAVFSSEDYGQQLAELWRCTHVMVDRWRSVVPISSQVILRDPNGQRTYLDPIVWEYFSARSNADHRP